MIQELRSYMVIGYGARSRYEVLWLVYAVQIEKRTHIQWWIVVAILGSSNPHSALGRGRTYGIQSNNSHVERYGNWSIFFITDIQNSYNITSSILYPPNLLFITISLRLLIFNPNFSRWCSPIVYNIIHNSFSSSAKELYPLQRL